MIQIQEQGFMKAGQREIVVIFGMFLWYFNPGSSVFLPFELSSLDVSWFGCFIFWSFECSFDFHSDTFLGFSFFRVLKYFFERPFLQCFFGFSPDVLLYFFIDLFKILESISNSRSDFIMSINSVAPCITLNID